MRKAKRKRVVKMDVLKGFSTDRLKEELDSREEHTVADVYANEGKVLKQLEKEVAKLMDGIFYSIDMGLVSLDYKLRWEDGWECHISEVHVIAGNKTKNARFVSDIMDNCLYNDEWRVEDLPEAKKAMTEVNRRIKAVMKKAEALSKKYGIDVLEEILEISP